jgi:hypothetical protein
MVCFFGIFTQYTSPRCGFATFAAGGGGEEADGTADGAVAAGAGNGGFGGGLGLGGGITVGFRLCVIRVRFFQ